jgi:hypothetical protein
MKVKLLKKLRKTHYIKYDMLSKCYFVYYRIMNTEFHLVTPEVTVAFQLYRDRLLLNARDIVCRDPRRKFIDVNHAVKPKLK